MFAFRIEKTSRGWAFISIADRWDCRWERYFLMDRDQGWHIKFRLRDPVMMKVG